MFLLLEIQRELLNTAGPIQVGFTSVIEAEAMRLKNGLIWAKKSRLSCLCVKGHSQSVINLLKGDQRSPRRLFSHVMD